MSGDHGHEHPFDPEVGFHPSCVTDLDRPTFDDEWQRRAFGLAVALSEFGHYDWGDFQGQLIHSIGSWEQAPADSRERWAYYEHWVAALTAQVEASGLLDDAGAGHDHEPLDDHDHHDTPELLASASADDLGRRPERTHA